MSLSLEGMKHMLLCFSPFVGNSKSLAEFARRIQSKKIKETNPNMELTLKPRLNVMPFIEVGVYPCLPQRSCTDFSLQASCHMMHTDQLRVWGKAGHPHQCPHH